MRIIIDIDEDVWMEAWGDWSDKLPDGKSWPATTGNLKTYARVTKEKLLAQLPEIERIRFVEETSVYDDVDDEGDDDE